MAESLLPRDTALGELKLVTVLFADVSGFTSLSEILDLGSLRNLVVACFDHLVPCIERYGGTVNKFVGDEIMALFGAPIAHENDPERALRAALEILRSGDPVSRYRFIEAEKHQLAVGLLCRVLQVSRAAYYRFKASPLSPRAAQNLVLVEKIRAAHAGSDGRYGSLRIHAELKDRGERASRGRIARLMAFPESSVVGATGACALLSRPGSRALWPPRQARFRAT